MFKGFIKAFTRMGAHRAAGELHRMGYHEEAKRVLNDLAN